MKYTKGEIHSLITRFETQQLPKEEWTHEAHLVVAIWYSSKYSIEQSLELVRVFITRYNESVGTLNTVTGGYHESITKFWLLVANDFLKSKSFESVSHACNDFINSKKGNRAYPMEFYSRERLFSVEARQNWIEPDLKNILTLELQNKESA